jgi:2'-hydroxyisoflavone reductase
MRDLLATVASAIHSDARITWVAADFLEAQNVAPWSDLPVWVPGQGDTAGFARRSNRKAVAAGLVFRPLSTTASETLAWFRAQSEERQAKLLAGLAPEREAALLAKWNDGSHLPS